MSDAVAEQTVPESGRPESWVAELLATFPDGLVELPTPYDIPQFQVVASALPAVAGWLKDHGFNMLTDVSAVDYLPRTPRFEAVYHLHALSTHRRIRLRVPLPAEKPEVATLTHLWPAAEPAEREVYDLFGIVFAGHPNLKRIMLPANWEGHPLRKDYPLRGPRANQEPLAERGRYQAPQGSKTHGS